MVLESNSLKNISANIGPILEKWGVAPYISASYAAPFTLANISSDPSNPVAESWWNEKVAEIKEQLPTFAGFVVKADSEGNQGPQAFNKTEADGANLLARAMKPVGGVVLWRAFVYGGQIGKPTTVLRFRCLSLRFHCLFLCMTMDCCLQMGGGRSEPSRRT
jgi:alpha-glucuronidase